MSEGITVRFVVKQPEQLRHLMRALEPARVNAILDAVYKSAFQRIGEIAVAAIRNAIRADEYEPNSPITVILKGSSKPLVDHGDLIQAVSYSQPTPRSLQVGMIKTVVAKGETYNIGVILHEGASIDVGAHPKVRTKVWAMVSEALGTRRRGASLTSTWRAAVALAGSHGGSGRKDIWIIPARPFISGPLQGPAFQAKLERVYEMAAKQAVERMARGS